MGSSQSPWSSSSWPRPSLAGTDARLGDRDRDRRADAPGRVHRFDIDAIAVGGDRPVTRPRRPIDPPVAAPLSALLAGLTVAPEHLGGYDRDLFPSGSTPINDGCNTRYEVLLADAVTPPNDQRRSAT